MQELDERDQPARQLHRAATEPQADQHPVRTAPRKGTLPNQKHPNYSQMK